MRVKWLSCKGRIKVQSKPPYIGRFAPSPTGPLHKGSLVAALASYLDAHHNSGHWRLRIDDIDPPRADTGATQAIITSLTNHRFSYEGEIDFQSNHCQRYDTALKSLDRAGYLFRCECTRATLAPGSVCIRGCNVSPEHRHPTSIRIRVPDGTSLQFNDLILGTQTFDSNNLPANFIVRRRDGLYAYQLATAIDDAAPAMTHIIRGRDLLNSTPKQIFIQHCLGLKSPSYGHLPIVKDKFGHKLSKQTGAPPLNCKLAAQNIRATLATLGQIAPPRYLNEAADILKWATTHWCRKRIKTH